MGSSGSDLATEMTELAAKLGVCIPAWDSEPMGPAPMSTDLTREQVQAFVSALAPRRVLEGYGEVADPVPSLLHLEAVLGQGKVPTGLDLFSDDRAADREALCNYLAAVVRVLQESNWDECQERGEAETPKEGGQIDEP